MGCDAEGKKTLRNYRQPTFIFPLIRTDTALSIPLSKRLNSFSLKSKDQFVNCILLSIVILDNKF